MLKNKFLLSLAAIFIIHTQSVEAVCIPDPTAVPRTFSTMCWSCIFPLYVAGVPLAQGVMPDNAGHLGAAALPVCVCPIPVPPFFRVGITMSFFNPDKMFEVVKDPMCSPALGIDLGASGSLMMERGHKTDEKSEDEIEHLSTFQAHDILFAPFKALGVMVDSVCVESPSVLDYLYVTEFDPMWQSSTLSTIINPEAVLLANPITQVACIADSAASLVFNPLDPLFWCMGSWGNAYPMNGQTIQSPNWTQAAGATAARLLYKMHRELLIWDESGRYTTCAKIPMPIWNKSNYRLQIMNPIPHPLGTVIGQSGMLSTWSLAKNVPMSPKSDNFSFMIFSRRGCCAF